MTVQNIVSQALKSDLETIALVNHDHDNWADLIEKNRLLGEEVEQIAPAIKVIIGAELSAYGIGKYGVSLANNRKLKFRLYSTNHYHLPFWEHPNKKNARAYAEHTLKILKDLILSRRADCIAHPFVGSYLINFFDDITEVTRKITDVELAGILELGKNNNVAWELNTKAIFIDPIFAKRLWNIGREVGVSFVVGTDAHQLFDIEEPKTIELKISTILL